ncbi:hypothetical protein [Polaribacter cellanae]|uniref:JmjC domain-containing protein n=1 Tax=Polaribacter cellanae TaxID=2818493 RepID=A0A975H806_9FLAO|nr:hypothetical protein [Polaribacter cellanae]QTE23608.1 hypothetical protein J3359_04825 [Polaribacter cellanae]
MEQATVKTSLTEKPKAFNEKWWDKFLHKTNNLTKTAVIEDCLNFEETLLFRKYVLEIIQKLAELRTDKYGFRVFVDGVKLDETEMSKIYDLPPLEDEELEEWVERVYKGKKFGMIINAGEKFNLKLSKNIALKTKPYFEKVGFPRDGINFSLFIGNYEKTPIGIHQDPPGQDVMHFHLGPGAKTMYTWGNEEYKELINTQKYNKQDVESLLPFSSKFIFKEGSIYFMPQGEYHIGMQDGLSIGITFWRYNHNSEILLRKLLSLTLNEFLEGGKDLLAIDKNDIDDVSGVDDILEILKIPHEFNNLNYKDLLRETYRGLRYSIHSNAGYRTSPFPMDNDILFKGNNVVQIEQPFKILYKESLHKEKLHVFVRGVKIELNNFNCIKSLIDKINIGKPLKVSELLKTLDKDWDEEIGLFILNTIYKNHGIIKVK